MIEGGREEGKEGKEGKMRRKGRENMGECGRGGGQALNTMPTAKIATFCLGDLGCIDMSRGGVSDINKECSDVAESTGQSVTIRDNSNMQTPVHACMCCACCACCVYGVWVVCRVVCRVVPCVLCHVFVFCESYFPFIMLRRKSTLSPDCVGLSGGPMTNPGLITTRSYLYVTG